AVDEDSELARAQDRGHVAPLLGRQLKTADLAPRPPVADDQRVLFCPWDLLDGESGLVPVVADHGADRAGPRRLDGSLDAKRHRQRQRRMRPAAADLSSAEADLQ